MATRFKRSRSPSRAFEPLRKRSRPGPAGTGEQGLPAFAFMSFGSTSASGDGNDDSDDDMDSIIEDAKPKAGPAPAIVWHRLVGFLAIAAVLLALWTITSCSTNYASHSNGAEVVAALTSPPPGEHWSRTLARAIGHNPLAGLPGPSEVLDENDGRCWEFAGHNGHIAIQLAAHVPIRYMRISQSSRCQSSPADQAKAPRDLALWGLVDKHMIPPNATVRPVSSFATPFVWNRKNAFVLLGRYEFAFMQGSQWFSVEDHASQKLVVLEVNSNWGSQSTCIYNIGIYA